MPTVYISIGNSDDQLSQKQWAGFHEMVNHLIRAHAHTLHGEWVSESTAYWQNACWCAEIAETYVDPLRRALGGAAMTYEQDSIAWAVAETQFITAKDSADAHT